MLSIEFNGCGHHCICWHASFLRKLESSEDAIHQRKNLMCSKQRAVVRRPSEKLRGIRILCAAKTLRRRCPSIPA